MEDYISRARLLRDPYFQEDRYPESHLLRMAIMNQPAAKVAPVVQCRECKYWSQEGNGYGDDESYCANPDGLDNYAKPNDFCSYGRRREGAE